MSNTIIREVTTLDTSRVNDLRGRMFDDKLHECKIEKTRELRCNDMRGEWTVVNTMKYTTIVTTDMAVDEIHKLMTRIHE